LTAPLPTDEPPSAKIFGRCYLLNAELGQADMQHAIHANLLVQLVSLQAISLPAKRALTYPW